ncbi:MAG: hypothetical protein RSA44_05660, partial [Bacteroides sp.]
PDTMLVLMSRVINTKHYSFRLLKDGTFVTEKEDPAVPPVDPIVPPVDPVIPPVTPPVAASQPHSRAKEESTLVKGLKVSNGEYYILTISQPSSTMSIDSLETFKKSDAISFKDMYLRIKRFKKAIDIPVMEGKEWIGEQYNPSYPYVSDTEPIYREMKKNEHIYSGAQLMFHFLPMPLTQNIKVQFTLQADPSVQITSVLAELSGIASSASLMTGYVKKKNLTRMIFKPIPISTSAEGVLYQGSINVLGLFRNENQGVVYNGDGIIYLVVRAEAKGVKKTFCARINLFDTIGKAKLLSGTENGEWKLEVREAILRIEQKLVIKEKQMEPDANDSGIDAWYDLYNIDIDV